MALGRIRTTPRCRPQCRSTSQCGRPAPTWWAWRSRGKYSNSRFLGAREKPVLEDFYVERNTVSSLLVKLGDAGENPVAGTRISTRHLDIVTYPSDPSIAPGNRFSVVLDIEPHPKIHLYAPGAKDYRVIKLTMEPNPQVEVLAMQYPDSEIYFFKPLNERVPVFQKPFRLVQGLVLDGSLQAQAALRGKDSVALRGSLEYQACDDRQCFIPVSVPLSWTMNLRSLVLERPNRQQ